MQQVRYLKHSTLKLTQVRDLLLPRFDEWGDFSMNKSELRQELDRLCELPHETEWLEFKEAKNQYDFEKLGKYFSALSNEANLNKQACGWLIFGVKDDRSVCGSQFRENPAHLDSLKQEIANYTTGNLTFDDIYQSTRQKIKDL